MNVKEKANFIVVDIRMLAILFGKHFIEKYSKGYLQNVLSEVVKHKESDELIKKLLGGPQ